MLRASLIWVALGIAITGPIAFAAASPLLAWRDAIYIAAGFAGIMGFGLMLAQPLLVAGLLPGLQGAPGRQAHRWIGVGVLCLVILHVGGLWATSPPDVIDALLLRSPTPFSVWGVIAMWALLATAILALLRRKLRPRIWRRLHAGLAVVIAGGTAVHALLIEGAMEPVTKALFCGLVLITLGAVLHRRGLLIGQRGGAARR